MIEKYEHHGHEVFVNSEHKGKHRQHCLCWQGCAHFRPELGEDNCYIANLLFNFDTQFHMVTPVFECPKYEPSAGEC